MSSSPGLSVCLSILQCICLWLSNHLCVFISPSNIGSVCLSIYPFVLSLSLSLLPRAMYYVKVMKKVLEKGADYVKTEYDRLGRILGEVLRHRYLVP